MITEKTKLILRLVEEQKITAEEAMMLMIPDPEFEIKQAEPFTVPYPYQPIAPYPYPTPWWQGPYIVTC